MRYYIVDKKTGENTGGWCLTRDFAQKCCSVKEKVIKKAP